MAITKALILVGGKGTRLGHITTARPKAMVCVAADEPVLQNIVHLCKAHGICDLVLATGNHSNLIDRYFSDGRRFGVSIKYSKDPYPLGTAGAIRAALAHFDSPFVLIFGDIICAVNLARLYSFHSDRGGLATLVVQPSQHPFEDHMIVMDKSLQVTAFLGKPRFGVPFQNLSFAPIFVLDPMIRHCIPDKIPCDLINDVFPAALAQGHRINAYPDSSYIQDIGTPERLRAAREHFERTRST